MKGIRTQLRLHRSLFVHIIFIVFMIGFIFFAYQVSFPQPQLMSYPVPLTYPPTIGVSIGDTDLTLNFFMEYNGTLTEGKPINISNSMGYTLSKDYSNIWIVSVGFQGAYPYEFKDNFSKGGFLIGGLGGVTLEPSATKTGYIQVGNYSKILLPSSPQQIFFPVSGEYSPTIKVTFLNGTTIQHTYDNIKVPVTSSFEVENQNISRFSLALAIFVGLLAFIEFYKLLREWAIPKTTQSQSQTPQDLHDKKQQQDKSKK